jgi:signal transduction histidine kinase
VRSLRNRLALFVFGVTFVAFAALYLYVSPGLQSRLVSEKLNTLSAAASGGYADAIAHTVGGSSRPAAVAKLVESAGLASGTRVTLLLVSHTDAGAQFSQQADSGNPMATQTLRFSVAARAVLSARAATGTESTPEGRVGEAARPVPYQGRVGAVIVYSAPLGDIARSVSIVQREILVAGGIALLVALILGSLVARALAMRVKRLERAAEQVAAGDFAHPIQIDSPDELGQLAVAFNQMQRQLAQLESARKQFIATASHELRTPIFSLGGFVELLEDEDLSAEDRRRFLDQVRDQVERLRKLSVDLLDLSKLDSGSLELRPQPVDIGELARSVSGEFEPALAQHDSHLELRMMTRSIDAICDPVRVAQIMRILIDNALTHTPSGSRIVVTAAREDSRVRLAVRDNGGGIDPAQMGRIFEPFYTADDAQGSGLGLAIASELAGRMHGRLSVESAPGRTVFTLSIPT